MSRAAMRFQAARRMWGHSASAPPAMKTSPPAQRKFASGFTISRTVTVAPLPSHPARMR